LSEALYERLVDVARARGLITYREVAALVGLDLRERDQRALLSELLRSISLREHDAGRPLLTAVVVSQDTNFPGRGFFRLARSLDEGASQDDEDIFERELRKVYKHWAYAASHP
jgi:hypothetical protein